MPSLWGMLLGNPFSRVAIAGYDGSARLPCALFMDFM